MARTHRSLPPAAREQLDPRPREARTLAERLEFRPRDVGVHSPAEAAVGRGDHALGPDDLTDLIIDAVFSPSDDSDADSYDTQETRFRHDAAVRAHAILEGEDAAILAGIRMAFADRVAWRIPHGRTLRLSWSSAASDLSLDPVQEGPAQ